MAEYQYNVIPVVSDVSYFPEEDPAWLWWQVTDDAGFSNGYDSNGRYLKFGSQDYDDDGRTGSAIVQTMVDCDLSNVDTISMKYYSPFANLVDYCGFNLEIYDTSGETPVKVVDEEYECSTYKQDIDLDVQSLTGRQYQIAIHVYILHCVEVAWSDYEMEIYFYQPYGYCVVEDPVVDIVCTDESVPYSEEYYTFYVSTTDPIPFGLNPESPYTPGSPYADYEWKVDDVAVSTNETYTYSPSSGTHTITLTISNPTTGVSRYDTVDVCVNPYLPTFTIAATGGVSSKEKGEDHSIDITITDQGNPIPLKYSIDWGDYTEIDHIYRPYSSPVTVTHHYTNPAQYTVTVYTSSLDGLGSASDTVDLTLTESPVVSFHAQPTDITVSDTTVTFVNTTTGYPTPTYKWWFGDGESIPDDLAAAATATADSTDANPVHTYPTDIGWGTATYSVALYATNSNGSDYVIKRYYIDVGPDVKTAYSPLDDALVLIDEKPYKMRWTGTTKYDRFIALTVTPAINRSGTGSITLLKPTNVPAEGDPIMVVAQSTLVFSGVVTRVSRTPLTEANVASPAYKYVVEFESDFKRLESVAPLESDQGTYTSLTHGEIVKKILPEAYWGDIETDNDVRSLTVTDETCLSQLNNLVSQTGYDIACGRDNLLYIGGFIADYEGTDYLHLIYDDVSVDYLREGDLTGMYFVKIKGDGKYELAGIVGTYYGHSTAYARYEYTEICDNSTYNRPGWEIDSETNTLNDGVILISPTAVVDYKAAISTTNPVVTEIANRDVFDYSIVSDKSDLCTKFVGSAKTGSGTTITSALSAIYNIGEDGEFEDTTKTIYRADGVLKTDVKSTDTVIYISGSDFYPDIGETIEIYQVVGSSTISRSTPMVSSSPAPTLNTLDDGSKVVVVTLTTAVGKSFPAGSGVYHRKIYVDNATNLTASPYYSGSVIIGTETLTVSSVGNDTNGDYLVVSGNRTATTDTSPHTIGTLVRVTGLTESSPHPTSPYAIYGVKTASEFTGLYSTKAQLERYVGETLLSRASITDSATATTYVNRCTYITMALAQYHLFPNTVGMVTPAIPMPSDNITIVTQDGETTYKIMSIEFDVCRGEIVLELGEYDSDIITQIRGTASTLSFRMG